MDAFWDSTGEQKIFATRGATAWNWTSAKPAFSVHLASELVTCTYPFVLIISLSLSFPLSLSTYLPTYLLYLFYLIYPVIYLSHLCRELPSLLLSTDVFLWLSTNLFFRTQNKNCQQKLISNGSPSLPANLSEIFWGLKERFLQLYFCVAHCP